eukprot:4330355-Pleurochrysis_carterae.AAC.2
MVHIQTQTRPEDGRGCWFRIRLPAGPEGAWMKTKRFGSGVNDQTNVLYVGPSDAVIQMTSGRTECTHASYVSSDCDIRACDNTDAWNPMCLSGPSWLTVGNLGD